ncbi:MAG TPA: hypothetical protein VJ124_01710, partial [Pyrinomonadaceae bacterium]|nr:hypothetical protein [Pyrinomonadaceae bacterium]
MYSELLEGELELSFRTATKSTIFPEKTASALSTASGTSGTRQKPAPAADPHVKRNATINVAEIRDFILYLLKRDAAEEYQPKNGQASNKLLKIVFCMRQLTPRITPSTSIYRTHSAKAH